MPRVYHKGATELALPMPGPDLEVGAGLERPIEPLCVDPAGAGMQFTITGTLVREGR